MQLHTMCIRPHEYGWRITQFHCIAGWAGFCWQQTEEQMDVMMMLNACYMRST